MSISQGPAWQADVLGPDYEALTLELADDDEGPVVATLVRRADTPRSAARVVLYLHGWSDYFFQTALADYWADQGVAFYALDLRKYGRSLRPHQTPTYIEDLADYDEEIDRTMRLIAAWHGSHARVLVMGHSTGGLIGALWAHRNPGRICGLVLNSPWLELQGSSIVRTVTAPVIERLAKVSPISPLPNIDPGFWARTVQVATGGEWTYDEAWRPTPAFPVRAGWLKAIIDGHATVARGLHIDVPVLVGLSARSLISPRWSEQMRRADVVIDVDAVVRRTVRLGPVVTVVRIEDGLHDLTLSAPPVRARFYTELTRWLVGYGWS